MHMCVGVHGSQRLMLSVFLDWALFLSTEAGCLTEARAHYLGTCPVDPLFYLWPAGMTGGLLGLHGFYMDAGKCFSHWLSAQPQYCGILTEIFDFPHSPYIYLLLLDRRATLYPWLIVYLYWYEPMDIYLMRSSLVLLIWLPNCSYFNHWKSFHIGY